MNSFGDKVLKFNKQLDFTGTLPDGTSIMNPFIQNGEGLKFADAFYKKYYKDQIKRYMILGINPGRFGSAVTGVPFTDSKRLQAVCKIPYSGKETHEPSAVFIYEMIKEYGGPDMFYKSFYINSICPLGFTTTSVTGREINHNYYDSRELTAAMYEFIVESIQKQLAFGIHTNICFCFGNGKNEIFLRKLNEKYHFFKNILALEHPRFIMQYKAKIKQFYISKYLSAFDSAVNNKN